MIDMLRLDRPEIHATAGLPRWAAQMTPTVPRIAAARYAQLIEDLKTLRKGRGIFTVDIERRVGPALRQVARIGDDDGPAETRAKVARRLSELADRLPTDLRTFALNAFAIAPEFRQPLYKQRVDLTAARIQRDPRTVRRRMDEALVQLAQIATARPDKILGLPATAGADWTVAHLLVSLILDRPCPELVEQCAVVAQRDALTGLTVLADELVVATDRPQREVCYGGLLDGDRLDLPEPVRRGAAHEYSLHEVFPSAESLRPRVAFTPVVRCDRFELRIRFDRTEPPAHVWRLGGAAGEVRVDRAGEVHLEFTDLAPGHEYGAHW
jgi:hypothetical protein